MSFEKTQPVEDDFSTAGGLHERLLEVAMLHDVVLEPCETLALTGILALFDSPDDVDSGIRFDILKAKYCAENKLPVDPRHIRLNTIFNTVLAEFTPAEIV